MTNWLDQLFINRPWMLPRHDICKSHALDHDLDFPPTRSSIQHLSRLVLELFPCGIFHMPFCDPRHNNPFKTPPAAKPAKSPHQHQVIRNFDGEKSHYCHANHFDSSVLGLGKHV
jgi:hypothetical protein